MKKLLCILLSIIAVLSCVSLFGCVDNIAKTDVYYYGVDGETIMYTIKAGEKLYVPENPAMKGYKFEKWERFGETPEGAVKMIAVASPVACKIIFYKVPIFKDFTINAMGVSSENDFPNATYNVETEFDLSTFVLSCTGFTFEGWYTAEKVDTEDESDFSIVSGGNTTYYTFDEEITQLKGIASEYGDINLYAKWSKAE